MDELGHCVDEKDVCPTRLTCLMCGRTIPYTDAELLDYIKNGLPRCCGQSMTIAPRQAPDGEEAPHSDHLQ